jgi:hypothetical protein
VVASVATPEHAVSLPLIAITFFCPDAPLGGQTGDSLRQQGPDYMEDVEEGFISVSGWYPWCKRPHVDGRHPDVCALSLLSLTGF